MNYRDNWSNYRDNSFQYYLVGFTLLLIALKNPADFFTVHLRCQQADQPDNGETTQHGYSSTGDRVDGITQQHIDNRETYTPCKTIPARAGRW